MTSSYTRDHLAGGRFADEFSDMLAPAGQAVINQQIAFFEGVIEVDELPVNIGPSEGERLALKRAMARYLIDSGIAGVRGWLSS